MKTPRLKIPRIKYSNPYLKRAETKHRTKHKTKYYKKGKKYYLPVEIPKYSPKEYTHKNFILTFKTRPNKRIIEKKTKEFFELHPELWYHNI